MGSRVLRTWRAVCAGVVLAVLGSLLVAPAARAELIHPRQEWLRNSIAGLFLHWGEFTAPEHKDCAAWEKDVTDGGWSADYWVDEARKLGASYITLATFHSRLGYARPWPSAIPGTCSTKRDFLGELVNAGKAKGVHVLLYMTDDPQWHDFNGVESMDSAAYSAYKGKQVDLTTRPGFGEYSYDLFFEVMQRYPDLGGFWIDNDNEYWEQHHLYEQIRQIQPNWLLSNNNEDTPIMDTVSNEQKTGMVPSYDYPAAVTVPMPRLTEADYKLPTTGEWWFDGGDHPVDVRLSTGRFITNAGSSVKSLMDETPMVNGKFPQSQVDYNNFMAFWLPPILSSLQGTEGGGYMFGGMQPGFWNDGAHGVITVAKNSPTQYVHNSPTQYVHVVTRPSTNLVRLRDNGYRVTGVTDVRTGQRLRFTQSAGYLSIMDITNWDTYDTVFKVDTAGQPFFYNQSTVKATASSAAAGFPASNLTDGSYLNYWDAGDRLPVSVTLDLGAHKLASSLAINQREWSPTHARSTFGRPEDSARIKDYRVFVSNDGKHWGSPVRTGALPSARGVQFIDLGFQFTRFIKLEVLNTWAGPQAPRFVNQLLIDELKVAFGYPVSFSSSLPLEAERAARTGRAHLDLCAACSGLLAVSGLGNGNRNSVTYNDITVPAAGDYRLQLDTTSSAATTLSVSLNGAPPIEVPVDAGNPDVPTSSAIVAPLLASTNMLTLFSDAPNGPAVDRVAVAPLPAAGFVPKTTLTVQPHGVQWVSAGQQAVTVSAALRLDATDMIDHVSLAPTVPAGWTISGAPITAQTMRLGQTISGTWTLTSPPGQDITSVSTPVTGSFQILGRAKKVSSTVQVRSRPADRVFMREAEDSANQLGSSGLTSCGTCSGSEKVRNIGGDPGSFVVFPNVTVPTAGTYTLFIDFTVNGPHSYFVTVNNGAPVEVPVDGVGNSAVYTASIPVALTAGANTIKIYNDGAAAPDLDRISLG